jgi:hypothetical protein
LLSSTAKVVSSDAADATAVVDPGKKDESGEWSSLLNLSSTKLGFPPLDPATTDLSGRLYQ